MALARVEGLVLRTRELGEADRIVTLLTRDQGKLQAVARGARRARSRLLAVVQPFAHANYLLFLNNRSLHTLSQGELINSFRHLREDLLVLAHATYIAEVTDALVPEEEPQTEMFEIVLAACALLDEKVDPEVATRWFELQALAAAGFGPALEFCVNCHAALDASSNGDAYGFSVADGGVQCPQCARQYRSGYGITPGVWQAMRWLLAVPAQKIHTLKISPADMNVMRRLLALYIEYRLEKRINALAFLQSLQAPAL